MFFHGSEITEVAVRTFTVTERPVRGLLADEIRIVRIGMVAGKQPGTTADGYLRYVKGGGVFISVYFRRVFQRVKGRPAGETDRPADRVFGFLKDHHPVNHLSNERLRSRTAGDAEIST